MTEEESIDAILADYLNLIDAYIAQSITPEYIEQKLRDLYAQEMSNGDIQ